MRRSPARQPRGSQGGTDGPPLPREDTATPRRPTDLWQPSPSSPPPPRGSLAAQEAACPRLPPPCVVSQKHTVARDQSQRLVHSQRQLSAPVSDCGREGKRGRPGPGGGVFSFTVPPLPGAGLGRGEATPVYITSDCVRSAAAPRAHSDPGPFLLAVSRKCFCYLLNVMTSVLQFVY